MTERESNKQRNFVIYPSELPLCRRMFCFETYDKRAGNYRMNYRKLMYRLKVKICNINRKSETVTDDNKFRIILCWWRWRKPKLRFVRCFAVFAFICPFCCRKRWTVRFRLPKKNEPKPKNRFRFVLVEMAVIETASENPSSMLSTSVGGLLSFPRRCADRQAHRFGIL